jgi:hypothetical protein
MNPHVELQQAAIFPFFLGWALGSETGRRLLRRTVHGVSQFLADLTGGSEPQDKEPPKRA